MSNRLKGRYGYPKDDPFKVTFHPDRLDEPLHWKKPSRIFICSMGDLFHEAVPNLAIDMIWERMRKRQQHTFMILTKRPERLLKDYDTENGVLPNLWLGVTAENQRTADERIPILLQIPAAKRFISVEPMLGPVDLGFDKATCKCCPRWGSRWIRITRRVTADWPFALINQDAAKMIAEPGAYLAESNSHGALSVNTPGGYLGVKPDEFEVLPRPDWVICGGETGPGARPMNPDWARSLRDQCRAEGVPFFFKQMGGKQPTPKDLMIREFPGEKIRIRKLK
jgi:protein gp37